MRKGKIQRRKDARPAEIVAAGVAEFAEHGFAQAKLDRIAKAAGIAKGTIYLYYPSKEALFLAVAEEHVVQVMAESETAFEGFDGSTNEMLTHLLTTIYERFVDGHAQTLLRIIIAEGHRIPDVVDSYQVMAIQRGAALLRRILERGVARGEVRETVILEYPQILIAPAIFYALHSMMFGRKTPLDRKTYFAAHIELIMNGVSTG